MNARELDGKVQSGCTNLVGRQFRVSSRQRRGINHMAASSGKKKNMAYLWFGELARFMARRRRKRTQV